MRGTLREVGRQLPNILGADVFRVISDIGKNDFQPRDKNAVASNCKVYVRDTRVNVCGASSEERQLQMIVKQMPTPCADTLGANACKRSTTPPPSFY